MHLHYEISHRFFCLTSTMLVCIYTLRFHIVSTVWLLPC